MKNYNGKLITFEGSEGSGKSTQIDLLCRYLKKKKKNVLFLREPGGVEISEKIREILLDAKNKGMSLECEILLYMAARAQLVEEVIEPALRQGKIILCDRFLDSTLAYQGYGCGGDIRFIKQLGVHITRGIQPDLTFVFDIEAAEGLSRIHRAKDRIEQRSLSYHNRVRQGYLKLAKSEPHRIKVIKVNGGKEEIYKIVQKHVNKLLRIKS